MSAAGSKVAHAFADGEDAVFTVQDALFVSSVTGGTGNLVKKGSGALTITESATEPYIEEINLQNGSVTVMPDGGAGVAWGSEVTSISITKDAVLNVSGAFALAPAGTFAVSGFADAEEGVYTLIEADRVLGGAALANWTFTNDVNVKKVAFLKVMDNRVVLEILPRGFVLTVR